MTAEEAAQKIKEYIQRQGGGVTFVELQNMLGEAARGDKWMGMEDLNLWWWFNMSDLFIDALELLRPEIEPCATSILVYLCEGSFAKLPVAAKARRYKKPHWVPIVWNMRKERLKEKRP